MPELPEVETIKEALKKAVGGAKVHSVKIRNRNFRESIPIEFENIVVGATIVKVWRFAKYAILDLDNEYSVIWHFGMSGKVKFINSEDFIIDKHDHIIFSTNKGCLIYNDIRRFGLITYSLTKDIFNHHLFKNIGIDPFDKKFTKEYLHEKLRNKKTPIKVSLLDQHIVNGIGNIYASEALYEAKISPFRESSSLTIDEILCLIESIKTTLVKAIKAGGSTLRDYRKPDGSTGYFQNQHCVYNKTGERCPNCTCDVEKTNGIQKVTQAGRSTFYCKILQK